MNKTNLIYEPKRLTCSLDADQDGNLKHGYWKYGRLCSICNAEKPVESAINVIFDSEIHFCYCCGARMDGEEK